MTAAKRIITHMPGLPLYKYIQIPEALRHRKLTDAKHMQLLQNFIRLPPDMSSPCT
jgi:hypothetical protein